MIDTTTRTPQLRRRELSLRARTTTFALALIAMTLAPGSLEAQRPGRGGDGPRGAGGSVAFLMEKSDELALTAEQSESFEQLVAEMRESGQPLRQKMQELRGSGDRDAMGEVMAEMRANDETSLESALALLDDGQKETAKKLLDARPRRRGRRPGR